MNTTQPRRFDLLDLAIVVITLALAAGGVFFADRHFDELISRFLLPDTFGMIETRWPAWLRGFGRPAERIMIGLEVFLSVSGTGLFLASLRGRRASTRVSKRFGRGRIVAAITCFFSMCLILGVLVEKLTEHFKSVEPPWTGSGFVPYWNADIHLYLLSRIFWAFSAGWIILTLTGRGRTVEDWPERVGRWLGWAWLVTLALASGVFALAIG